MHSGPEYWPVNAATYEKSVQDAVDLVWFSFPDEDPIIIEERSGAEVVAVWTVPTPPGSEIPPTARHTYRVDV